MLEAPLDTVLDAVDEAKDAGLVADVPGRPDTYTFCHALVREAIYEGPGRVTGACGGTRRSGRRSSPTATCPRRRWHRTSWPPSPCSAPGARSTISVRAGQQAAEALAYEEAEEFYQRALVALEPVGPEDEEQRSEVLLALGRVRWQAGDRTARDCFREVATSALARGAPNQLARAALGLAERSWEADIANAEARSRLASALELLSPEPSVLRARVLALLGENQHFTAEAAEGARNSSAALAMARELVAASPPGGARARAMRSALASALIGHHIALLDIEHVHERLELVREARSITDSRRELSGKLLHWHLFAFCGARPGGGGARAAPGARGARR